MTGELDLYWVALCKDGPVYVVAGPFGLWDQAEDAISKLEHPSTRCYYEG